MKTATSAPTREYGRTERCESNGMGEKASDRESRGVLVATIVGLVPSRSTRNAREKSADASPLAPRDGASVASTKHNGELRGKRFSDHARQPVGSGINRPLTAAAGMPRLPHASQLILLKNVATREHEFPNDPGVGDRLDGRVPTLPILVKRLNNRPIASMGADLVISECCGR